MLCHSSDTEAFTMLRLTFAFCLVLLMSYYGTSAQPAKIDSLKVVLRENPPENDSLYRKLLNDISFNYAFVNTDSGLVYGRRFLNVAKQQGSLGDQGQAWNNIGVNFALRNQLDSAVDAFLQTVVFYQKAELTRQLGGAYNNIGQVFYMKGNYDKSIEYYEKALPIQQALKDSAALSDVYGNIGAMYETQGNYSEALRYQYLCLDIKKALKDYRGVGIVFQVLALIKEKQQEYPAAIDYYQQSVHLHDSLGNVFYALEVRNHLADATLAVGDTTKAYEILQDVIAKAPSVNNNGRVLSKTYFALGEMYAGQKRDERARQAYQQAYAADDEDYLRQSAALLGLARLDQRASQPARVIESLVPVYQTSRQNEHTEGVREAAKLLAWAHAETGDYAQAYQYQKTYHQIKDSLFNAKQVKEIARLEGEYEFEKERQTMEAEKRLLEEEQARQRVVLIASLIGLLAVLVIAGLFYRQNQLRKKANQLLSQKNAEISTQKEEIEQQNQKLVELDRFKEQMTGMIVHDLKNPLNTVLHATDRQADLALQRAHQASQRMLQMVMNMLDVQKFSDTQIQLKPENRNVSQLFAEAIDQVRFDAEVKNIRFVTDPNALATHADPELTSRVLMNLLSNAVKYSPQNSQIYLTAAKAKDGKVKIAVRDEGTGIPKDQQQKVFERFGQADARKGSTGLGLTFCKLVVEAHGGQIGVDSEFGKGSTFWFTLPEGKLQEELEKPMKTPKASPISLSQAEKTQLEPLLVQLREVEVYQASQIDGLLRDFDFSGSEGLTHWKAELDQAVFACNEMEYERLLAH